MRDHRRYVQIADSMRAEIKSGKYLPGTKMPSKPDLAVIYATSQDTIRKAFDVLVEEDLIQRVDGLGYYLTGEQLIGEQKKEEAIPREDYWSTQIAQTTKWLEREPQLRVYEFVKGIEDQVMAMFLLLEREIQGDHLLGLADYLRKTRQKMAEELEI